jgi:hypothetical protein
VDVDRRGLLGAALGLAAGAAVAGCTNGGGTSPTPAPTTPSPTPTLDPDLAILTAWWQSERRLLDSLPTTAAPLRAAHAARLAAVAEHLAARGAPPPSPSPSPRPVTALVKAELDASARYLKDLAAVASNDVAVLGAELAAGARQHATVLVLAQAKPVRK